MVCTIPGQHIRLRCWRAGDPSHLKAQECIPAAREGASALCYPAVVGTSVSGRGQGSAVRAPHGPTAPRLAAGDPVLRVRRKHIFRGESTALGSGACSGEPAQIGLEEPRDSCVSSEDRRQS